MQRGEHRAFTLVELLVVIAIIGLLVALLLPAVQSAREAGRRSTCVNNLKQISLAVHNFHSAHGKVPAACYYDETPTWFVLILPYLEDSASYEQWDLHARWHAPVNERARVQNISIYRCPSRNRGLALTEEFFIGEPHPAGGLGDYAGNAGPRFANLSNDEIPGPGGVWSGQSLTDDGVIILQMWGPAPPANPVFQPHSSRISWKKITDGQSKTFLAGEKHVIDGMYTPSGFLPVSHGGGADGAWCACNEWMFSARLAGGNPQLIDGQLAYDGAFPIAFGADDDTISQNWIFGSWHPSICHFAMCDGSVHALSVDADPNILGRLAQRHDGEIVAIPD